MGRGRKCSKERLMERLKEIQESITKQEDIQAKLKAEKKECEQSIRNMETDELLELMAEKNMTVEDVRTAIEAREQV